MGCQSTQLVESLRSTEAKLATQGKCIVQLLQTGRIGREGSSCYHTRKHDCFIDLPITIVIMTHRIVRTIATVKGANSSCPWQTRKGTARIPDIPLGQVARPECDSQSFELLPLPYRGDSECGDGLAKPGTVALDREAQTETNASADDHRRIRQAGESERLAGHVSRSQKHQRSTLL